MLGRWDRRKIEGYAQWCTEREKGLDCGVALPALNTTDLGLIHAARLGEFALAQASGKPSVKELGAYAKTTSALLELPPFIGRSITLDAFDEVSKAGAHFGLLGHIHTMGYTPS
jgi:hypothetical protein